jgi:hypothetical protein
MSEPQTTALTQLAKHLRQVHFGGNWSASSLKDQLADITWQEATTQVHSFHTIAALVYHMNYYVSATLGVLQGGPLDAKDKHSFDLPPIQSQEAWDELLKKTWDDAENLARRIEQLPESQLWENFVKNEYGSYYRCLLGPIEYCHYHLGQIALIKKMLKVGDAG